MKEYKTLLWLIAAFGILYYLPIEAPRFQGAIIEAFRLSRWYAREHVLLCLVPAFFIAGAIGVFVSQNAVMKYFGPKANKALAYGVASVSGTILAVCSCTVLPIFGSIYMRGAGLGPAVAFLYSGPAINVLAIVLTARVLGWQLGVARAVGAIVFSVVIGLLMHLFFFKEERAKAAQTQAVFGGKDEPGDRPLGQVTVYFLAMVGILVFANWGRPLDPVGLWFVIFKAKWLIASGFAALLGFCLWRFFGLKLWRVVAAAVPAVILAFLFPNHPIIAFAAGSAGLASLTFFGGVELNDWRDQTWGFAKQILPLLFAGVLAAGFFLGSPESKDAGMVPNVWIQSLVGDSPQTLLTLIGRDGASLPWLNLLWPVWTNFFASITGALMYFATLTEVPILRGLIDSGMGQGPALALLLAGPALSLPNMLVINSILGPRKTLAFIGLVVVLATVTGLVYGRLVS
ncbi:MAG: permease [Verrucomicrobia bacterium]|nr:permease [Verrucomicrobiota bacterium]MCG2678542.1 permease [Kiritimatiellia bacterium]MBU4247457.1 permease [Verrucomicrobiota bacterium]MBU4292288.1 permease [Verrucomicrobiota bacterium]MBU4429835.1 permease [Verrucomicrobiota bacterium]